MQTISDTINGLHLGEAASFEGLTVFPLFGDHVRVVHLAAFKLDADNKVVRR